MITVGFHASHEQIGPAGLLRAVIRAEQAGFGAAMCSDHFAPWSAQQGHSGHAWGWLGAALEATRLPIGVVTAPGQRYHPAITAQAIGTFGSMYPGRFWAALGSGEALNEHITGTPWPGKAARDERLLAAADVIRALLAGDEVTADGPVRVDRARLWTLPEVVPQLLAAAVTPATAAWAAGWADGLITVNRAGGAHRRTIAAYRDAGGTGPVALQFHVCLDPDRDRAARIAHEQWRTNVFAPSLSWELSTPAQFEEAARHVSAADVEDSVFVTDDPSALAGLVSECGSLGIDRVYLHHVGQEQDGFIDTMGDTVLPQLRGAA